MKEIENWMEIFFGKNRFFTNIFKMVWNWVLNSLIKMSFVWVDRFLTKFLIQLKKYPFSNIIGKSQECMTFLLNRTSIFIWNIVKYISSLFPILKIPIVPTLWFHIINKIFRLVSIITKVCINWLIFKSFCCYA